MLSSKNEIFAIVLMFCILLNSQSIVSAFSENNPIEKTENEKEHWAVIIAGGLGHEDRSQSYFDWEAYHAWSSLIKLGYKPDHVFFLSENETLTGVNMPTTRDNIKYAITEWLANRLDDNDDCFIFLTDHGGIFLGDFYFGLYNYNKQKEEYVSARELNDWLKEINYNICTILIEACQSGMAIPRLSQKNRIIMTTSGLGLSYGGGEKIGFSYHFFRKLKENASYGEAWEYADAQYSYSGMSYLQHFKLYLKERWELTKKILAQDKLSINDTKNYINEILILNALFFMNPKIDDNGDGVGHGSYIKSDKLPIGKDGDLALITYPNK